MAAAIDGCCRPPVDAGGQGDGILERIQGRGAAEFAAGNKLWQYPDGVCVAFLD
ncbi:hypothetical protein AB0G04_06360 [Actinoplanes sp. NPDC023801]|uniref:hypothetical protein n=1 Tax=Actinoplanes sp. NPDC023801 TaxID=3154595 RepID=UPI0033D98641